MGMKLYDKNEAGSGAGGVTWRDVRAAGLGGESSRDGVREKDTYFL